MQSEAYVDRVRDRFESDFLPRYGGLWREMIETRQMAMATTVPNFLDAIESKTAVSIAVPKHRYDCECVGCTDPVLEWEALSQEEPPHATNASDSEDQLSSSSNFITPMSQYDGEVFAFGDVATPSPDDCNIGNFGADVNINILNADHVKTEVPDKGHGKPQGVNNQMDLHKGMSKYRDTPPESDSNDEEASSDDWDELNNDEDDDREDGGSQSSGSTVINFDISFVVQSPLIKDEFNTQESAAPSNHQNGRRRRYSYETDTNTGQLEPEYDASVAQPSREQNPFAAEQEVSLDSSRSADCSFDLSHLVRSPGHKSVPSCSKGAPSFREAQNYQKTTTTTLQDDVLQLFSPEKSPRLSISSVATSVDTVPGSVPPNSEIINLIDSDTDDDDGVLLSQSAFLTPSQNVTNKSGREKKTSSQATGRQFGSEIADGRRATTSRSASSHSSDDQEWNGESSNAVSFDSPSESEDERVLSFSKGQKGNGIAIDSDDDHSENINPKRRSNTAKSTMGKAAFKRQRASLTQKVFSEYDKRAFDQRLSTVAVVWSNKLRTTAGLTRLKKSFRDTTSGLRRTRLASIELSTKVLDSEAKLRSTLLHEMVHAAAWIVDGVSKPPHGACFKKWARIAMGNIPDVEVTTTHDYEIEYKYAWACTKPGCDFVVKRHSRSVDLKRHLCGRCRGKLVEINSKFEKLADRTAKKRAPPSEYNRFVKENSKAVREKFMKLQRSKGIRQPKICQSDVMKECARLWRERKQSDE